MRAGFSGLAVLLAACAGDAPAAQVSESSDLCPRLAAFGRSVPPGEARTVTLSGEGLLGTQTCERGDAAINPGGAALCAWWVVNSHREFFGENFKDVVDCLLMGRKVDPPDALQYSPESGYLLSGRLALASVPSIDKELAADVTFNLPGADDDGVPVRGLRITFRKNAKR